jgi:uncharacterized protein
VGVSAGNLTNDADSWRSSLIEDASGITEILGRIRRVAVIGIKTAEAGGPAYYVPEMLPTHGIEVVPVPVYFPDVTEILGQTVHRSLATVVPPADTVLLFRRPADVPKHLDDILAAQPQVVWMQLGIRQSAVAETLARAGIRVVQDRCLKVEIERRARS